jgi:hypothetical protein
MLDVLAGNVMLPVDESDGLAVAVDVVVGCGVVDGTEMGTGAGVVGPARTIVSVMLVDAVAVTECGAVFLVQLDEVGVLAICECDEPMIPCLLFDKRGLLLCSLVAS